ncbi:MAG: dockerin type I repeat-containing protein [Pirellulales bacterium]
MSAAVRFGGSVFALAAFLIFFSPPAAKAQEIFPGFDLFATEPGTSATFETPFGDVEVPFKGVPLGPNGETDTIVRRHAGSGFPLGIGSEVTVPIEIVALNLVSINPIQIGPSMYNVTATADPSPLGTMTIHKTSANGGTFDSLLPVFAKVTFTDVDNPNNMFMTQVFKQFQGTGRWSHFPSLMHQHTVATPAGGFHPGVDPITGAKIPATETAPRAFHVVRPPMGRVPKWSQLPVNMTGENIPSDVDWRDIMLSPPLQTAPNWTLADDFISDGRPINAVRWWGSYFDPAHEPTYVGNAKYFPVVEDGFAISFFTDIPANQNPAGPFSQPGELLGSYFAPETVVRILPTDQIGWDGHRVWEYEVSLDATHGDHLIPGVTTPNAFNETAGQIYWVSITAENGHDVDPNTWQPLPNNDPMELQHYWGWHTSPDVFNDVAVMGDLQMPGMNWVYENWMPIQPAHGQFDLAFELLTGPAVFALLVGDYNRNGKVDAADYVIWRKTLGLAVPAGSGADGNGDGFVTIADYPIWRTNFGDMAGSGSAEIGAPEPSSLSLIVTGICGCLYSGPRRRVLRR